MRAARKGAVAAQVRQSSGPDGPVRNHGPMVKRTSCLVSTEVFRVRVLVGLLEDNEETEGQPDWRRDPVGSRLSDEP